MRRTVAALALSLACGSAGAANKCIDPSGSVTYQDAPCPGAGKRVDIPGQSGIGPGSRFGPGLGAPTIGANYLTVTGPACKSMSDLDRVLKLVEDREAMYKLAGEFTSTGACRQLQDGQQAILSAYTKDLVMARIRVRGEPNEVWVFITSVR